MRIIFLLVFLVNFIFGSVAIVSAFKGEANVIRGGKNLDVKIGFKLEEGDVLLSKDKTKIQLIFNDKTIITIGKNSKFSINEYIYDETKPKEVNAKFGFAKGMFRTITGKIGKINPNRFKIKAHSATIGIRGTKFDVVVNDFQTKIGVIKGGVYFLQNNQITDILSGEMMIYTIDTGNMEIKDGILIETQEFYDKNDKVKERINSVKKVFNSKIKILKDKILKDRVNITIDPIVDNLKIEVVKLFQNSLDDTTDNILDDENYNSIRDEIVDYYNDLPNDDLSTILEQFILTEVVSQNYVKDINDEIPDVEYGYWKESVESDPIALYASVDLTPSSIIDGYINQTSNKASYSGGISAIVTDLSGATTSSDGSVTLNIDFSNQTLDGRLKVTNGNWQATIRGAVNKDGFSSLNISGSSGGSNISGNMEGKFAGSNGDSVGGTFSLTKLIDLTHTTVGSVTGVFGAKK